MKTVVVTLTDEAYFHKAKNTINDVRSRGKWDGDLVLITIGFDAPTDMNIINYRVEHINTSGIINAYRSHPIRRTCDNREFDKLTQWDKFYVFDSYFLKWDKVIFLDAGLRVFDKIQYLADIPCNGQIMAPDDAPHYDVSKRFGSIIETDRNPEVVKKLFDEYDSSIISERYFLNCIWMYDTSLLQTIFLDDFVDAMNKYPICRCNEMTIMNLIFTFKHKVWKPFPDFIQCEEEKQKRLFGWNEFDRDYGSSCTWKDFCFIKYPGTLKNKF